MRIQHPRNLDTLRRVLSSSLTETVPKSAIDNLFGDSVEICNRRGDRRQSPKYDYELNVSMLVLSIFVANRLSLSPVSLFLSHSRIHTRKHPPFPLSLVFHSPALQRALFVLCFKTISVHFAAELEL